MSARVQTQQAELCLWRTPIEVGDLQFVRDGRREYSSFDYRPACLAHSECFQVSPDLPLATGRVTRRAPSADDSPFPFALADTEPDAWGRRIIDRARWRRRDNPALRPLTRFDYRAAVDDELDRAHGRSVDGWGMGWEGTAHDLLLGEWRICSQTQLVRQPRSFLAISLTRFPR